MCYTFLMSYFNRQFYAAWKLMSEAEITKDILRRDRNKPVLGDQVGRQRQLKRARLAAANYLRWYRPRSR